MKVVEIFRSIEGEGARVGLPVTFIRLWGCNLRCEYCDTPYSHSEEEQKALALTTDEIVERCEREGCKNITITGGEPMIHLGFENLVDKLLDLGYSINIETNGTQPVPNRYKKNPAIMFTMDYKCNCSGMNDKMDPQVLNTLSNTDVLKFVVGSKADLDQMLSVRDSLKSKPQIFVSPVFGQIQPADIVRYILMHRMYDVRVQVQLHKIIWDPEERGV